MTRIAVEKACFALQSEVKAQQFRADPDALLADYALSEAERAALKRGDVGALYRMDVTYGALGALAKVFGYDDETYVRKLRDAAGLPEDPEQISQLRRRAAVRRN